MNDVMVGAISGVIAAVIGSVITAWLSYRFQKVLFERQLQSQKELMAEQHKFQVQLLERELDAQKFRDFQNRTQNPVR